MDGPRKFGTGPESFNQNAPSEGRFDLKKDEKHPEGWCDWCKTICTRNPTCAHGISRPCACSGCPEGSECKKPNPRKLTGLRRLR